MNKYSIVFFDTANAKKTHRLFVTKIHTIALFLLLVALLSAQAILLVKLYQVKSAIAEREVLLPEIQSYTASQTSELLESAIAMLQQDDIFIREIYEDTKIINAFYSFENVAGNFSMANSFYNMYNLNKHSNFQNMMSMLRLTNMVSKEYDTRISQYECIEEYLEEQYVIYRHTPSIWPSPTERVTSLFGFRKSPFTGIPSYHEGTDMSAQTGTPLKAAADGVVVFAGTRTGYGYLVTIDHGFGYMTRYAHNSRLLVKAGDRVNKGDIISLSGATGRSAGPHLHYEVLYNGTPVNSKVFLPNEGR